MEKHQLTKRDYEAIRKITADKRAIKELIVTLREQLSDAITKEDKWWQSMSKKLNLNHGDTLYTVSFTSQEVVGTPKQRAPQPQAQEEIKKRERPPEISGLISPAELEAMKKMQAEAGGE